jgi:molybdopterin-binding protein
VTEIKKGLVNSMLKLTMGEDMLSANITNEATEELAIAEGDTLYALIKANTVILAK